MRNLLSQLRTRAAALWDAVLWVAFGGSRTIPLAIGGVALGALLGGLLYITLTADDIVRERAGEVPHVELDVPAGDEVAQLAEPQSRGAEAPSADEPEIVEAERDIAEVDPELLGESPNGPIPREARDGRVAWQLYARPAPPDIEGPTVAVVLTGMGMQASLDQRVLDALSADITLAYNPYAPEIADRLAEGRDAGHETMLMVPMEPRSYPRDDPGAHTLLTGQEDAANLDDLEWVMSRAQGYVGLVNMMGDRFLAVEEALAPMLDVIGQRGLAFVDTGDEPTSVVGEVAEDMALPHNVADIRLDAELSRSAIDAQLAELTRSAQENGSALAVARVRPVTVSRLEAWQAGLAESDVTLVPATAQMTVPEVGS